ncbi:MAG: hypothetical protein V4475_11910 [Pseudomonadota bacterium]
MRLDLSLWDLIPLGIVLTLAIEAYLAHGASPPARPNQPVRVSVERNGETGIEVCQRYDVPSELCEDTEIQGNRANLLLDPDPARPEAFQQ